MLHPQARNLIDLLQERGVPPTHKLSPSDARRYYRERRYFTQPDAPQVALVQDLEVPGPHGAIPLRLYKPSLRATAQVPAETVGQALPVLVYFHGGGWVIGDLDTHDTLCRDLANGAGCAVVAVDYRMGPENRFPAAVDDCLAAARWVHDNAASLGLDASRLAVGGDSAGGNLAAVISILARDLSLSGADSAASGSSLPIAFQLLIYPSTDMRRQSVSHTTNGQGYLLTSDSIAYYQRHYIGSEAGDEAKYLDWRASPLLCENLANLPPALVLTAGYDPLRDEGLAYAQRLTQAGNRATHICFERQIHGFITMGRMIDEANPAVSICTSELKRHFAHVLYR